jgi:hypothetical protein
MKAIKTLIHKKETGVFKFKPNEQFYRDVKINHKRWGLIYRGETEPLVSELQRIADYFQVDITELLITNGENND